MEWTLSDFYNMEVIRHKGLASIIVDIFEDKPVKLWEFKTDAALSDMEIREEAWEYYNNLPNIVHGYF